MKRVVITGAAGHLGRKLFDMLEQTEGYEVCGLDLRPCEHPAIHIADFAEDGNWIKHLVNTDVIVHLAGDRDPTASWHSAIRNNMDATLALYHHAVAMGVKRVIFASSNRLQGGRRFGKERLNNTLAPHPVNAYGMSKLFGERTGAFFSTRYDLSVICLRIGWTQWTHDNKPGRHMAMGQWGQEMWLSDHDFLNGMRCAIDADNIIFEVLHLMSDNPGMRWDIEPTKKLIGYRPQDEHVAQINGATRLRAAMIRIVTQQIPDYLSTRFPDW